jgi:Xaa-Pro aminopeptidase
MPESVAPRPLPAPPIHKARNTPGMDQTDAGSPVDMRRMRAYRLARVRAELKARDYCGALLFDPLNIRYATGSRNMAVWTLHNVTRYLFVPTEGPITLFDFHGCEHLSKDLETIDEVRHALTWIFFYTGGAARAEDKARRFAAEIDALVRAHGGGNKRLAVDRCDPVPAAALAAHGILLFDAQEPLELARAIKSADEIACMNASISVTEAGMARMRAALEPGMSENELWSILHQTNIAMGGEWIETRLLASGGRTNPWFQECSDRVIRAGELVSFDTDLIGPFGYCADLSRSYLCGPGRATDDQRRLYGLAMDQIHHNVALLKPGLGFRELCERAWQLPESVRPNRYSSVLHGVGLADEYPHCPYAEDFEFSGVDGEFTPGMTVCVESYIGEVGGHEGVKLEQQVLITDTGIELLSTFPFEDDLMPSRWV